MKMKLNEHDKKLIDIHSTLIPFAEYGTTGSTWYIITTEDEMEFKTYRAFISYIETEAKESLLVYAMNGELMMLAEALGEEA